MKNSVWIAVSFSVLSSIAQGQPVKTEAKGKELKASQQDAKLAQNLNLGTKPEMNNSLPCVAGSK